MGSLRLIAHAVLRGLRVRARGDRILVQGPKSEEALAQELLANKAEILALVRRRSQFTHLDPVTAKVLLVFDGSLEPESKLECDSVAFDANFFAPELAPERASTRRNQDAEAPLIRSCEFTETEAKP